MVGSHAPRRELAARQAYGSAGERYRLRRILGEDGRTLVLPVDHGLTLGRVEGLQNPTAVVEGLLVFFRDSGEPESGAALAATVEQAAARGVDCVKLFMAWRVASAPRPPRGSPP